MPRALTIEAVGTGLLVLIIALAVTTAGPLAPLAIGLGLAALVYMGGPVSGAHYNPAVSLCLSLTGALPKDSLVPYIAAQCSGALIGAALALAITNKAVVPAPGAETLWYSALLVEATFTFMLCLVILGVAVAPAAKGRGYFGLAIGLTILTAALAGGSISGGAFNPAVATGLGILGLAKGAAISHLWLYFVGPVLGAFAATLIAPAITRDLQEQPK